MNKQILIGEKVYSIFSFIMFHNIVRAANAEKFFFVLYLWKSQTIPQKSRNEKVGKPPQNDACAFQYFLVLVSCVMYNDTEIDVKGFERICFR